MGLYDDIRIDYPIEGVQPFSDQTKELECYQCEYRIDESGQLLIKKYDWVPYSEEEQAANIAESCTLGEIWNLTGKRVNGRWEPASDTALLAVGPDDETTVLIYLLDGKVKDVTVKREAPQC